MATSVFLVDSSKHTEPESGIYFLQQADKLIVRRFLDDGELVILNGKSKHRVSKETFTMLKIVGKCILTLTMS